MRYLIALLIGLIMVIILFGAFTFFELTPNIAKWGDDARFLYVMMSILIMFGSVAWKYLHDDEIKVY